MAVEAPDLCPRYTARVIRGVKIGPSPAWLRDRLATIGIAAINNVVDITNYVLMECGQPLHAFDLHKLAERKIVVRRARAGEMLEAINHKSYTLEAEMCVIADAERAVALAGVMGGAETEVTGADARRADRKRRLRSDDGSQRPPASSACTAIRPIASSAGWIRKGSIGPAAAAAS